MLPAGRPAPGPPRAVVAVEARWLPSAGAARPAPPGGFGGVRRGGGPLSRNDLTMVAETRKVLVAPRGRERLNSGSGPGEPSAVNLFGAQCACRATPQRLYADGSGILECRMRFIGPGYSGRGGFDRKGKPGKLKESPRGAERKFRNSVSVCFLRTQQRAKSQCMIDVQTPVGAGLRALPRGFCHDVTHGWVSGFRGLLRGVLAAVIQRRV